MANAYGNCPRRTRDRVLLRRCTAVREAVVVLRRRRRHRVSYIRHYRVKLLLGL